jgi:hypothetical protein
VGPGCDMESRERLPQPAARRARRSDLDARLGRSRPDYRRRRHLSLFSKNGLQQFPMLMGGVIQPRKVSRRPNSRDALPAFCRQGRAEVGTPLAHDG